MPEGLVETFPEEIQKQLILDLDPHGNIQVSQIETEKVLIRLVKQELERRNFRVKFQTQEHFFGYEGRCALPTNFDANYTYALGRSAAQAIQQGLTGVICGMRGLKSAASSWQPTFVPLLNLMHLEVRKGVQKPVIQKALVDLKGKAFAAFAQSRKRWELEDCYNQPGPIQFSGSHNLTDRCPVSLILAQ